MCINRVNAKISSKNPKKNPKYNFSLLLKVSGMTLGGFHYIFFEVISS